MPLPILHATTDASPQTLVRLFHQTERDYVRHLSEETPLDVGTAFHNAELKNVFDANCVLDAAVPDDMSAADAVAQASARILSRQVQFSVGGSSICQRQVSRPSHSSSICCLKATPRGRRMFFILRRPRATPVREIEGLTIIPSRASFRHARQLAEEGAKRWNEPTLADAAMLHLDDPHWDSLIALRDNVAVAHIAVLAVGEVGRIEDVFVSEKYRRLGIGRTMMSRALEICARSLFKHVMLCTGQDNAAAQALYASLGFRKIGTITSYDKFAAQGSAF